jgi:hypothetical protein
MIGYNIHHKSCGIFGDCVRNIAYGCLLALVIARPCHGQATQPTQPTAATDSPKAAIKALVQAMSVGDASTMRDLLYAATPSQQKLVDAMTNTAVAIAELNRGMAEKFGEAQARAVLGDPADAVRMTDANLDKAGEQIEGDAARVSVPHSPQGSMSLKRIDGKWKVDVAAYVGSAAPEQIDQTLKSVEHGITAYRESLADINAGKFKTAKEAGAALRAKISPAHKPQ